MAINQSRRSFLKAATAFAIAPLPKTVMAQPEGPLHDSQKIYDGDAQAKYHLPELMRDVNFLGYRPVVTGDVSLQASPFAFAMPQYTRAVMPEHWDKDLTFTVTRDAEGAHIDLKLERLPENVEILKRVSGILQRVNDGKPLSRIDQIKLLSNQFRDFKYEPDTGSHPDVAQTVTQFIKNKKGDCEDFAIARYSAARMMGIPADEMAIVFYSAGDRLNVDAPSILDHVMLSVYDPSLKNWFVIDGTGRDPATHEKGMQLAYENREETYKELFLKTWPNLTPIMGWNENGWFALDSISKPTAEADKEKLFVPKKREPVAAQERPAVLIYEEAKKLAPAPRAPQPSPN